MSYHRVARPNASELAVLIQDHRTLEEAAAALGVAERTLRRWLAKDGIKVDRTLRVVERPPQLPWWRRLLGLSGPAIVAQSSRSLGVKHANAAEITNARNSRTRCRRTKRGRD